MKAELQRLQVLAAEQEAGVLAREGDYVFAYSARATEAQAVSLTMPVRSTPYVRPTLHPVFQINLPEGFVLERLRLRLAKSTGVDPMVLLGLMGASDPIGRLRLAPLDQPAAEAPASTSERLSDLLAYRGASGLFESLVDRYIDRTALSGVQPKVLVPETDALKASARTSELIVKSGLDEFPGLAINEFICMSAAKAADIPVPEFHLSDDRSLFIIRRFDRAPDGQPIGFEDMAALAGLDAADKYRGRYEGIVRLVDAFCAEGHRAAARRQVFDIVALSCIVGNGDAHLKNFGVLYTAPDRDDVRLAPAFDIVNTTCYLPDDALALSLGGSRSLFAARLHLLDFARTCGLSAEATKTRLRELCEAVAQTLGEHRDLADEVRGLTAALERGVLAYRQTFG